MRLLLIEDDKETANTIKEELVDNYIVELAFSGEDGEYQAQINEYDLIILDLGLPDIDGLEVCRRLRENRVQTPILILTGEDDTDKKVSLLDCGADDYLTKPFEVSELKARLKTLLRRSPELSSSNILSIGDLTIDLNKMSVTRGIKTITLRRKEFYLLEYLARNVGRVITREMILDHIWESSEESITNIIDVHIKYLRDQIDRPFEKKLIKTVHGLGYKLEA